MRLLVITQVVDSTDTFLGFFHRWIEELATKYEKVSVICLKEGEHQFPSNVRVYSLGKESGESRRKYVTRFFRYLWKLRKEYDAVFVHMNQEYVLLAGWLWKLTGKRIYMWRNHYSGTWLTDVAAVFATKVFCTSRHSYTAKYRKTVLMPVGLDIGPSSGTAPIRMPRSILFLARFAPSKRPHVLLEALGLLAQEGVEFVATFVGSAQSQDTEYRSQVVQRCHELGLEGKVHFREGVPHAEVANIFGAHEFYVNLADSGMYDKTLFEAVAQGCIVLATSDDFTALAGNEFLIPDANDVPAVAQAIRQVLMFPEEERSRRSIHLRDTVLRGQDLRTLGERLVSEMRVS